MKVMKMARIAVLVAVALTSFSVIASAQPVLGACKTTGNLDAGSPSPSSYTYTVGTSGSTTGSIPLTAPSANTANCNPNLPATFGNTGLTQVTITIYVQSATIAGTQDGVDASTLAALKAAFVFGNVTLTPGNVGAVPFTFTNPPAMAAGSYDIHFKTDAGGRINDVNASGFVVTAAVPTAVDTQKPDVAITSPGANSQVSLNGVVNVAFTADDPSENGVGTGVIAVRASISSAGGAITNLPISVTADPTLPVPAAMTVTATGGGTIPAVGSFRLDAEADDDAGHTGSAATTFSVRVGVTCLPPISIVNRQFNTGSTVPVKWAFIDANSAFVAPYPSIQVVISAAGVPDTIAVAGAGSSNVRWDVDAAGNATQYIVNYPVPLTLDGKLYTARLFVADVDGNLAEQGQCTFLSAPAKGGKTK